MQAIKISIPEPCHENWQAMTPTEQGRFCNSCAKEVIDFSKMTDEEVLGFFTKKTETSNVCGRVLTDQLDRKIIKPVTVSQKITWYWKYIVASILLFTKFSANAQKGYDRTLAKKMIAIPAIKEELSVKYEEKMIDKIEKGTTSETIKLNHVRLESYHSMGGMIAAPAPIIIEKKDLKDNIPRKSILDWLF